MRRFLLILVPALILIGVFLLNREAANWHYVVPADVDGLLYASAFDGFLDEWEQYEDGQLTAAAEDGVFRLVLDAPEKQPYSLASPVFSDFDLHVTAQALEGPLDNAYGVIFRFVDNDNHYRFLVSSDGYYGVFRMFNGAEKRLSDWISSPIVNQGLNAVNRVRVLATGNQFQFYVNDQLVPLCIFPNPEGESTYSNFAQECVGGEMRDTLVDDSIPVGRLGVAAESFSQPGVVVEFDNLLVFAPEAQTE